MKITADENIPRVREIFGVLGNVTTLPGRKITADDLTNTDILLVRSVTQVNACLLKNTPVKFVGSATIGEDHIDSLWLQQQGIGYANAPGSNAQSVAEYVAVAVFNYCQAFNKRLQDLTLGIVGEGNVGLRVRQLFEQLNVHTIVSDPPKALALGRNKGEGHYLKLEQMLQADILTFHTPLTVKGPSPTWHMVDDNFLVDLAKGKTEKLLINTARGGVVDNCALLNHLSQHSHLQAVLDVWENEPVIDVALLEQCFLASPHVAGYSQDGKSKGVEMVYKAACDYFELQAGSEADVAIKQHPIALQLNKQPEESGFEAVLRLLNEIFPIQEDDKLLRQLIEKNDKQHGEYFDQLRKNYRQRKEFSNYSIAITEASSEEASLLSGLGFSLVLLA